MILTSELALQLEIPEEKEAGGNGESHDDQPSHTTDQHAIDGQQHKPGADRHVPPSEQL